MYICNYCGKKLWQEHEKCPACGASSFETRSDFGEMYFSTPPKDGYKINTDNYKNTLKKAKICIIIGVLAVTLPIIFPIIPILLLLLMFGEMLAELVFFVFIMVLPIFIIGTILISIGIKRRRVSKQKIARAERLAKEGTLVKNMPYKIINTGTMVMGKYYKCIQVNFKNSSGVEIPLYSETKFDIDEKSSLKDTVDLLIDPDDYSNYFIDYEISLEVK